MIYHSFKYTKTQLLFKYLANKKDWRYSSKKLYEEFNVLNINNPFLKTSTVYLKKHNLYLSITHKVNAGPGRLAKQNQLSQNI